MKARAWFESQGQRAASLGHSLNYGRASRYRLPEWARRAYVRGFLGQLTNGASA